MIRCLKDLRRVTNMDFYKRDKKGELTTGR